MQQGDKTIIQKEIGILRKPSESNSIKMWSRKQEKLNAKEENKGAFEGAIRGHAVELLPQVATQPKRCNTAPKKKDKWYFET